MASPQNDETLRTLEQVFRQCFMDPQLSIEAAMVSADVDGWDSLSHVRLLMMIENRFGIELPVAQTTRLQNIGELARLISSRIDAGAHSAT